MYHEIWDRNALRNAFIKDNPDIFDDVRNAKAREMAKAMLALGDSVEKVAQVSGLTEEEIKAL